MKDKHEIVNVEECSLFNSEHAYARGMSVVACRCGWKSWAVKARDTTVIFQTHVIQQVGK